MKITTPRVIHFLLISFITLLAVTISPPHVSAECGNINPSNGLCTGSAGNILTPSTSCGTIAGSPNPYACCTSPNTECASVAPPPNAGVEVDLIGGFCTAVKGIADATNVPPWLRSAVPGFGNTVGIINGASKAIAGEKQWYRQTICQFHQKVFNPDNPTEIYGERYTYAQVNWIINSLINTVLDVLNQAGNIALKGLNLAQNNNPRLMNLSTIEATKRYLERFSPVKTVNAQGFGYTAIAGVQSLWVFSRNTAYLLLVVALVAVGFAVMFRVKINPQTAISIQIMIPKIIGALVMITFSYAIVGLVIDFVYVLLGVLINLAPSNIVSNSANAYNFLVNSNFLGLLLYFTLRFIVIMVASFFIPPPPVFGIVAAAILLIVIFKVWWSLVMSLIRLVILIIAGPWMILLGIVPGTGQLGGSAKWFKSVVAEASTFVVIPLLLGMGILFMNSSNTDNVLSFFLGFLNNSVLDNVFAATGIAPGAVTSLPNLPLMYNSDSFSRFLVMNAIGIGFVAMSPTFAGQVRKAIGGMGLEFGTAIGTSLISAGAGGLIGGATRNPAEGAKTAMAEVDRIRKDNPKVPHEQLLQQNADYAKAFRKVQAGESIASGANRARDVLKMFGR